ncbi:ABC transporter substrate-binding protein [Limnobacter alexandrii]|uniref:ABC transporter substrate-binding protein n=1 Tax=Limnobacter alexandrii TaxID=2570352 RepID=UPI001FE5D7FB|nr:helical backbone metal receptor [Limnobacter alexandrii]
MLLACCTWAAHAAPQRIVSLLPSLTESVCALGECSRLVGVDRYSNWPASVQQLPRVGGGIDPNIEAIVALKPDLVLMAESSRAAERLQALGLKVLMLEPKTHEQVQVVIAKVAQALGLAPAKAEQVWRKVDAGVSAAASSLPQHARGIRVYFEVNRAPYAAGESSFIGQTLKRLGVGNVVPAELGPFPKLNPEFVVRANPDLIMVGQRNVQGMTERPGWQRLRAVREQRICIFNSDDEDAIVRPGPRMAEGARLLAQCILKHSAGAP